MNTRISVGYPAHPLNGLEEYLAGANRELESLFHVWNNDKTVIVIRFPTKFGIRQKQEMLSTTVAFW